MDELTKRVLESLRKLITIWIKEDEALSDITTDVLGISGKGRMLIFSKNSDDFILAGANFIEHVFRYASERTGKEFIVKYRKDDGAVVKRGDVILEIEGDRRLLLSLERLSLNLISRLSGVATETRKMVDVCSEYGVEFWATRKTTPGLRYLEKYAVCVGGGRTHRLNLKDAILVKDNHIEAVGGMEKVVDVVRRNKDRILKSKKNFELEVQDEENLCYALQISEILGRSVIMLDNISFEKLPHLISEIRRFSEVKRVDVKIEISGGIRPSNVRRYAELRPDRISSGYVTLSPAVPDISADLGR